MKIKRPAPHGAIMLAACCLAAPLPLTAAQATEAPVAPSIVVEGQTPIPTTAWPVPLETDGKLPYSDTSDYLRSVPGMSAGRMGGHGLEPVIRGQTQGQINIISDGAYHHGGCPNRMDPPTSYSALSSFDSITVLKGYQSVLTGPGATGGAVILERDLRRFAGEEPEAEARFRLGFDDNGDNKSGETDIAYGNREYHLRYTGGFKDHGNYTDGGGAVVRSSFADYNSGLTAAWTPNDTFGVSLNYEFNRIDDALFAGAGMDSPESRSQTLRFKGEKQFGPGAVEDVKFNLFTSLVDHEMDNYSLRTPGNMRRRVRSDSNTIGGKATANINAFDRSWAVTMDSQFNDRNAVRFQGTDGGNVNNTQSFMWPDIEITQLGFAGETTFDVAEKTRLIAGGRYDFVYVSYGGRVDDTPDQAVSGLRLSANQVYERFYGYNAEDQVEHNLGGLLRLEHDITARSQAYGGISRAVRTADATERGLANFNIMMGTERSWVGNPEIKPEAHHQLDVGYKTERENWSFDVSGFGNYVHNYILRDSARGQEGIVITATSADVYRNIDALLVGAEMSGDYQIMDKLTLTGSAQYTFGQNLDEGIALAQMPPLEGRVGLEWDDPRGFALGTNMRWALKQNRVDLDSSNGTGRDVRETPGYAVFDIYAAVDAFEPAEIRFGVSNLLDKKFSSHLNRSNSVDAEEIQVNEPGRSFYISATAIF